MTRHARLKRDPAKPLDIDRLLVGKLRDRIYRVGIELEGGWKRTPEGVVIAHDGSVKGLDSEVIPGEPPNPPKEVHYYAGEIQSEPLEVGRVAKWVKQFYPHRVNDTCGLHVHMSFKSAFHYQLLMVPEFQATILLYLQKWAEVEGFPQSHYIWNRLAGRNVQCQAVTVRDFYPDLQARASKKQYEAHQPRHEYSPGHRYTVINYCYGQHTTLECRVLPMMEKPAQAIAAVQRVLSITNASLVALAERQEKLRADIDVEDGEEKSEVQGYA